MIIKACNSKLHVIQQLNRINNNGRFDILDNHDYIIDFIYYLLTLYNDLDIRMLGNYRKHTNIECIISINNPVIYISIKFNTVTNKVEVLIDLSWTKNRVDKTIIYWRNRITTRFEKIIKDKNCNVDTIGSIDGNTYNRTYYIKN